MILEKTIDYTSDDFVTVWRINSSTQKLVLPASRGYHIDWGDGCKEHITVLRASHDYATPGIYRVVISNEIKAMPLYDLHGLGTRMPVHDLLDVEQWGTAQWETMKNMFYRCVNLKISATDAPDMSRAINMSYMFLGCRYFNSNINHWDTSQIRSMWAVFEGCTLFNQPLDKWDTGKVNSMWCMFKKAEAFNQNIGNWDLSRLLNMTSMFHGAAAYNQPVNDWDTSSVSHFNNVFFKASTFNQPIDKWDLSSVEDAYMMLYQATDFNQDLYCWKNVKLEGEMGSLFGDKDELKEYIEKYDATKDKQELLDLLGCQYEY